MKEIQASARVTHYVIDVVLTGPFTATGSLIVDFFSEEWSGEGGGERRLRNNIET